MLFSSMPFIFVFLPIVCLIYLLARKDIQNYVLLIASIIFYAWGEPSYLAIMLATIIISYCGACLIERTDNYRYRKCFLILTLLSDLGFLIYFKYFNFIAENINIILTSKVNFVNVIMPIGISFYTFQAISYIIDVYRKDVKAQRDIYKVALYITLFPQLIAGPIVKYHDVEKQITNRTVTFDKVSYGVKRFIVGLSKKMLLANTMGEIADKVFSQPVETFGSDIAWIGAIAYTLQLYYDFSGYSDMAIGLGSIFGFKFMENFNYPYISKSITEFWRRWHISLSTWFKEYLYIPLGGNRISSKRTYFNLFIVFLATGIWHGASWTFIVWGLWNGFFIIFERLTNWHKKEGGCFLNGIKHLYTMFVFIIGWVLFRAENIQYAIKYIKNMFGCVETKNSIYQFVYYVDNMEIMTFIVAVLCTMPIFNQLVEVKHKRTIYKVFVNLWLILLFVLSVIYIASSLYNPFIYFIF